uniref:Uncharacterized protein n=1 Tax=Musca domestica TaxID=7370 RepID=A0A1I8NKM5_MUSDO
MPLTDQIKSTRADYHSKCHRNWDLKLYYKNTEMQNNAIFVRCVGKEERGKNVDIPSIVYLDFECKQQAVPCLEVELVISRFEGLITRAKKTVHLNHFTFVIPPT